MTQKTEIADEFNRFFQSVFTMPSDVRGDSNLQYSCACPMEPLLFDQEGVFSRLLNLDAKKASGPDKIPTAFLKRYAEWVSFFLVIIFKNLSKLTLFHRTGSAKLSYLCLKPATE